MQGIIFKKNGELGNGKSIERNIITEGKKEQQVSKGIRRIEKVFGKMLNSWFEAEISMVTKAYKRHTLPEIEKRKEAFKQQFNEAMDLLRKGIE